MNMNIAIWTYVELVVTLCAACILYLIPLRHRLNYGIRLMVSTVGLCLMTIFSGIWSMICPAYFVSYTLSLLSYFLMCFLFIFTCAAIPAGGAVYCAVWTVITQQAAKETVVMVLNNVKDPGFYGTAAWMLAIYSIIYGMAGVTIVRYMPEEGIYQVGPRQFSSALFLFIVFGSFSGFSKTIKETPLPGMQMWNILPIQCCCILILYLQNTLFKKSAMKQELDTLNRLWHQQKEQYELSRETIALINHKCHDLKHQIAAMRIITSPEDREKYLREIEDSVQIYDAIVKTGNEVLDTVLTEKSLFCSADHIKINCIADGGQLDIFDPVDLYTVFGNAIDNAIEGVKQLTNQDMRMIDVLVYVRNHFLLINIMNPIGNRPEFDGELPISTKTRNGYHGFGLKSIRHIIEKYYGFMKIDMEENVFSLKILIPITKNKNTNRTGRK